jgi:hypothetical protein
MTIVKKTTMHNGFVSILIFFMLYLISLKILLTLPPAAQLSRIDQSVSSLQEQTQERIFPFFAF